MPQALQALLNYTSSQLARPPSCKQPPLTLTPYRCREKNPVHSAPLHVANPQTDAPPPAPAEDTLPYNRLDSVLRDALVHLPDL